MSGDSIAGPDLWTRVIDRWHAEKVVVRSAVDANAIEAFERKYGVVLPRDVGEYFSSVDGMGEDDFDNNLYRFWQLKEVKPVEDHLSDARGFVYPGRYAYPSCFVFADWSLNCWDYAVKLTADRNQPAPVYRVDDSDFMGEPMAESFREFMERYAVDPKDIA